MTALLEAKGLAIDGRLARCDISLAGGELTMLVGPNGAGKTSLLRAMARIGEAEGETCVAGENISRLPPVRRAERMAFMGASRDIAWPLLARDFVALALFEPGQEERIENALDSLDASDLAGRRLDRLSTGERSRIMLARALAPKAEALLLDEPCANLDPQYQLAIVARLREETRAGAAVLMSVHDLDLARHHADRVLVMDQGALVADGSPEEALTPDIVRRIFAVERDDIKGWRRI